jgi:hypothetical protein
MSINVEDFRPKYKINQIVVLKRGVGLSWKVEDLRREITDEICMYQISRDNKKRVVKEDEISFGITRRR